MAVQVDTDTTERLVRNDADYLYGWNGLTNVRMQVSVLLGYEPASPGGWGSPAPSTIIEALDTIIGMVGTGLPPDGDYGDIVITGGVWGLDSSINFAGKTLNDGTIDGAAISNAFIDTTNSVGVFDTEFSISDSTTPTAVAKFDATNISSGTLRSFAFPDASGTIALTANLPNTFGTISVSGQSDVVADSTADTLTLAAGSGVTITTNAGTDTITIAAAGSGGTVTTTGSPANGNLTKFSGATSVTNGDLSGDVTTSGTLAATIANDAVTYAKMQNVSAASKLLGRGSAGGSGDVEEITISTGLTLTGTTLTASGGSTKYRKVFRPRDNEPPTTNFATLDTRNGHPVLDHDTTTQEASIFSDMISAAYGGGDITVAVTAALTSATTGTLGWDVTFERVGTAQDIDSDSFATAQTITATTVPGTSGFLMTTSVSITAGAAGTDSLAAGEAYRLRIRRDVANDTAAGDAELWAVVVTEN